MGSVYTEESVGKLNEAEFYERFGIGSVFFGVLLDRLTECHEEQHSKGGRPNLLSVFQSLVVFLLYTRQYMTQTILADIMGVKNGTCQERTIGFRTPCWRAAVFILSETGKPERERLRFLM